MMGLIALESDMITQVKINDGGMRDSCAWAKQQDKTEKQVTQEHRECV